jgi:hypothetical protein
MLTAAFCVVGGSAFRLFHNPAGDARSAIFAHPAYGRKGGSASRFG